MNRLLSVWSWLPVSTENVRLEDKKPDRITYLTLPVQAKQQLKN